MRLTIRTIVLACTVAASLAACVKSGDSGPAAPVKQAGGPALPPPPPSTGLPPPSGSGFPYLPYSNSDTGGGHWWGWLSRGGQVVNDAMCLLVESGELACYLTDGGTYVFPSDTSVVGGIHGTVKVSATSQATGSGKIYATPGNVLADGVSSNADFTITGGGLRDYDGPPPHWLLGRPNGVLELTFTSLGEETSFYGLYDHYYAALGFVWPPYGVYSTFDIYGDPASLSADVNGDLFMQSASGCTGNGRMTNIDLEYVSGTPGYNAYTVDLTVSDCSGFDGAYEGLATLLDFGWVNGTDNLLIAVFNDTNVIIGEAIK